MAKVGRKIEDALTRFNKHWVKDENTDCWLWQGPWGRFGSGGYGVMWGGPSFGVPGNITGHRASWILHCGHLPDDLIVCHRCDTPSCVNPAHLFLGTFKDNTQDMLAKNRSPKGETSYRAMITEADVHIIRDRSNKVKDLAKRYRMSVSGIEMVRYRRTWKHIP